MAGQASKSKSGLFEIHALEAFFEKKFHEMREGFRQLLKNEPAKSSKPAAAPAPVAAPAVVEKAAPAPKAKKAAKKAAPKAKAVKAGKAEKVDAGAQLDAALEASGKKAAVLKAGKQKDQLLRALLPLYLSKGEFEVTSGTTSKFWSKNGVSFAAPNVAKALREHAGYARRTAKGAQLTPNGVKYVEAALAK